MVVLNASNLSKGGGLANAVHLINYGLSNWKFDFIVLAHSEVKSHLVQDKRIIECSVNNLLFGDWLKMNRLIVSLKPRIVYTIFGPSIIFIKKSKHIAGFAQGHLIYQDSPYWTEISLFRRFLWSLKWVIFITLFSRVGLLVVESRDAAFRLKGYSLLSDKIKVLNNTPDEVFYKRDRRTKNSAVFTIGLITANYPHKNVEFVVQIAKYFEKSEIHEIDFVFTLMQSEVSSPVTNIKFVGKKHGMNLVDLYDQCDAIIIPSSLETFPGNILEALLREKVIIAPSLPYIISLCGNAFVSYNYGSLNDCISQIIRLKDNIDYRERKLQSGRRLLDTFLTTKDKYVEVEKLLKG